MMGKNLLIDNLGHFFSLTFLSKGQRKKNGEKERKTSKSQSKENFFFFVRSTLDRSDLLDTLG
jgi:hypothetical protein